MSSIFCNLVTFSLKLTQNLQKNYLFKFKNLPPWKSHTSANRWVANLVTDHRFFPWPGRQAFWYLIFSLQFTAKFVEYTQRAQRLLIARRPRRLSWLPARSRDRLCVLCGWIAIWPGYVSLNNASILALKRATASPISPLPEIIISA